MLAVDPSSPFTGGAILGDRVRMQDHATDPGVFIRSMATRGHLGGLSLATPEAIRLLDALGHRWILVETVGVGQVEVEVAGKADTTVVVVNPGWGDSVQANKAGLMEVADVFVINKADRPGVEETRRDLQQMLELSAETAAPASAGWAVPIVATVGTDGAGVAELWDAITRPPRRTSRGRACSSGAAASASARSCARSSPAASSSGPASCAPASAGTSSPTASWTATIDPWSAADEMLEPVLTLTLRPDAAGSARRVGSRDASRHVSSLTTRSGWRRSLHHTSTISQPSWRSVAAPAGVAVLGGRRGVPLPALALDADLAGRVGEVELGEQDAAGVADRVLVDEADAGARQDAAWRGAGTSCAGGGGRRARRAASAAPAVRTARAGATRWPTPRSSSVVDAQAQRAVERPRRRPDADGRREQGQRRGDRQRRDAVDRRDVLGDRRRACGAR